MNAIPQAAAHARDWIDVLQALLTPAIAVAVGCIAFAQWWIARNKLKLDLFDRRWEIYTAVRELIAEILRTVNVTQESRIKFLIAVRGTRWLFDARVEHYVYEELHKRVTELQAANSMLDSSVPQQDREKYVRSKYEISMWIETNDPAVERLFGEFLQMDQRFSDWARLRWRHSQIPVRFRALVAAAKRRAGKRTT